jgi:predicted lipoprotein with Yx(FWY)xxD motif
MQLIVAFRSFAKARKTDKENKDVLCSQLEMARNLFNRDVREKSACVLQCH